MYSFVTGFDSYRTSQVRASASTRDFYHYSFLCTLIVRALHGDGRNEAIMLNVYIFKNSNFLKIIALELCIFRHAFTNRIC